MNDIPNNEQDFKEEEKLKPVDEYAEFETIFSDPTAHNDKAPKKSSKKRLTALIAGLLAVAVLVGGTIAIIKLIPVIQDDTGTNSPFEDIQLVDNDSDDLASVTVTNKNGTFKLLPIEEEQENLDAVDDTESGTKIVTVWYLEGIDRSKTNSYSVETIVDAAAAITATREITTKTAAECGFDDPTYKVTVAKTEGDTYTVLVGDESPDSSGTYLKLAESDKIYLVDSESIAPFDFKALDLADTTSVAGMEITDDMSDYLSDDAIYAFDSLTISGKNFPVPVVFGMNDDDELADYVPYCITSPSYRLASNLDNIINTFNDGFSVDGAYAYDTSAESIAAAGLNDPYMVLTMKIKNHTKTYRLAKDENGDCAIITDGETMIKKVPADSVPYIDFTAESFYSGWISMQSINDLSNMTFTYKDEIYDIDIVYNVPNEDEEESSDEEEEEYIVHINGKKITASYFQNFYTYYVGLTAADFTTGEAIKSPDMSVKISFSTGRKPLNISFGKSSETKYQYDVDGVPNGKITSSSYNKILKYLRRLAEGKDIK